MPNTCIDTNIWVYALTRPRHGDDFRHKKAQAIITRSEPILITPQIVNEMGFVLKRKHGWIDSDLRPLIEHLQTRCIVHIPSSHWHLRALDLRIEKTFSYWDSLIVAAALEAECDWLLSEDMQHRQVIDGRLTIINPFTVEST